MLRLGRLGGRPSLAVSCPSVLVAWGRPLASVLSSESTSRQGWQAGARTTVIDATYKGPNGASHSESPAEAAATFAGAFALVELITPALQTAPVFLVSRHLAVRPYLTLTHTLPRHH